jgi:hypothetical protein
MPRLSFFQTYGTSLVWILFILALLYVYSLPRYSLWFPTLPIYDNQEADIVATETKLRNNEDVDFFQQTDISVVFAFAPHVPESPRELASIVATPFILYAGLWLKYFINRPRPYQIRSDIDHLHSETGNTPAMPAGHAFQAYYLAHVLSKKYPEKRALFNEIAEKCDFVRIRAGIHYPSDGQFSKRLLRCLISAGIM